MYTKYIAALALSFLIVGCGIVDKKDTEPTQEPELEVGPDIAVTIPAYNLVDYPVLLSDLEGFSNEMTQSFESMYVDPQNLDMDLPRWALDIEMEVLRDDDVYVSVVSQTYMYT